MAWYGRSPSFQSTELHLFGSGLETPSYSVLPSSAASQYLALLTENGIYHGKLALSPPPSSADADILRYTHRRIIADLTQPGLTSCRLSVPLPCLSDLVSLASS